MTPSDFRDELERAMQSGTQRERAAFAAGAAWALQLIRAANVEALEAFVEAARQAAEVARRGP